MIKNIRIYRIRVYRVREAITTVRMRSNFHLHRRFAVLALDVSPHILGGAGTMVAL